MKMSESSRGKDKKPYVNNKSELEERLKGCISELIEQPDTIAFIDEIHSIMGAGAAEGKCLCSR